MKKPILLICSVFAIMLSSFSISDGPVRLFTGTYTEGTKNGFFIFDLNREAGTFKLVSESDAGPNPSYFCLSRKNGFIYAANEVGDFKGVKGGGVTALLQQALLKKQVIWQYRTAVRPILQFLQTMTISFLQITEVDQLQL
jgi:hypothetical protein